MSRGTFTRTIEAETVVGAVTGDKRHQALLLDFIYRTAVGVLTLRAPDLDDARQQAWLRIREVVKSGRFDPSKPNATAFIRILVVNIALDQVRSRSESWRPGSGPQGLEDCADPGDSDPSELLDQRGMFDRLMNQLEEDERAVILLACDDLSMEEIGDALGIPAGTVRSRLHRAKEKLMRRRARLSSREPRDRQSETCHGDE